jgi:hypothetical protein
MALKLDVRVPAEGGIELGARLFLPERDGPHAAITMAHGFAGTKEHGLERFAQAFAAAGVVVLVHDHAISGRAVETSAGTSIRGDRLRTGVAQSLTLSVVRKLNRPVSVYGARVMPADTLSCLARPIDACAASLPRFQRSAVTSRDCGGFHLTPRLPWNMPSMRTRERNCAERRRAGRQWSAAIPPFQPPTAPKTPSIFFSNPFRKVSGKTR